MSSCSTCALCRRLQSPSSGSSVATAAAGARRGVRAMRVREACACVRGVRVRCWGVLGAAPCCGGCCVCVSGRGQPPDARRAGRPSHQRRRRWRMQSAGRRGADRTRGPARLYPRPELPGCGSPTCDAPAAAAPPSLAAAAQQRLQRSSDARARRRRTCTSQMRKGVGKRQRWASTCRAHPSQHSLCSKSLHVALACSTPVRSRA